MRIKFGEVFAFYVEQKKQYGIIQVLGKGKINGYDVRVLYYLIDNIDDVTIKNAIQTIDFYYIKNFHTNDLLTLGKRLGCFAIPEFVAIPRCMRESERKPNGDLYWYVMEDLKVTKTFKKFNDVLKPLSPAVSWGIQYIIKRWLEEFTLDNWHELEEKWYNEYLKVQEPHKFFIRKKEAIIKQFKKSGNISQEALKKLDILFSDFAKKLLANKEDSLQVNQIVKTLVFELNIWNSLHNFIDTEESEIIIEYISTLLEIYDCAYALDVMDAFRDW